jgi:hypothetical protein
VFRIILVDVKRLSPDERNDVEQSIASARASFETLDPTIKTRLPGEISLRVGSDPALYRILEDDGETSEQRDVIAPMNEELAPGSEVALEGSISTLFHMGPEEVSLHFADRVVAADWEAFWSQGPAV